MPGWLGLAARLLRGGQGSSQAHAEAWSSQSVGLRDGTAGHFGPSPCPAAPYHAHLQGTAHVGSGRASPPEGLYTKALILGSLMRRFSPGSIAF